MNLCFHIFSNFSPTDAWWLLASKMTFQRPFNCPWRVISTLAWVILLATTIDLAAGMKATKAEDTSPNDKILSGWKDFFNIERPIYTPEADKTQLAKRTVVCPDGHGLCSDGWSCVANENRNGYYCISGLDHYVCPTTNVYQVCTGSQSCWYS